MSRTTKRCLVGLVLTLGPVISIHLVKQSAWGKFIATPSARQRGDAGARLVLVEYSDFQCPMCARVQPALHQFLEAYKGKVRLAFKHFPLIKIHNNALPAARAAECAARQDGFWPYQDRLFQTQEQWAPLANPATAYMALAQEVRLDVEKFRGCLADPSIDAVIMQDHAEGTARQITATPTLFVGNERLVGTFIESDGARRIERELRK